MLRVGHRVALVHAGYTRASENDRTDLFDARPAEAVTLGEGPRS